MTINQAGVVLSSTLPAVTLASESVNATANNIITLGSDKVILIVINLAIGLIGFFLYRTLKQNDKSHEEMFKKMDKSQESTEILAKSLERLIGAHNTYHQTNIETPEIKQYERTRE
jgi:ABC-type transport system involved in Fe-S cluster assembly fused permease/ATPase subunit